MGLFAFLQSVLWTIQGSLTLLLVHDLLPTYALMVVEQQAPKEINHAPPLLSQTFPKCLHNTPAV